MATVETEASQQRDQLHLLHGLQGDLFDADGTRSQEFEESYVDLIEDALGSTRGVAIDR